MTSEDEGKDFLEEQPLWNMVDLTLDEVISCDPEKFIEGNLNVDCYDLAKSFEARLREIEDEDSVEKRVLIQVYRLCYIHFRPKDAAEPFGAVFEIGGQRSAVGSDFRGKFLATLAAWAPQIKNPALRARVADIVWFNQRANPECARIAIDAYCACLENLKNGTARTTIDENHPWSVTGSDMLYRAMTIAYALGKNKPQSEKVRALIRTVLEDAKVNDARGGYMRLSALALRHEVVTEAEVAATLEQFAHRFEDEKNEMLAHDFYLKAKHIYRDAEDDLGRYRCMQSSVSSLIRQADTATSSMVAAHWLMDAIAELKGDKTTRDQRDQLQRRLVAVQKNINDEMVEFSVPLDLADLANATADSFKGLPFVKALFKFSAVSSIPQQDELRERALTSAESSPIMSMMSQTYTDHDGKVVGRAPGLDPRSPNEEAIRRLILESERHYHTVTVGGQIEPARIQISADHAASETDIFFVIHDSPFIPLGHEVVFAKGISRLLSGDYISAAILLVPQLENSMRYLLLQKDIDHTKIKHDMTQEDLTLSIMLEKFRIELEQIFGADLLSALENIFVIKNGPNLRNSIAHGLLIDNSFYSPATIYGCWLIFRLVVLPLYPMWQQINENYEAVMKRSE